MTEPTDGLVRGEDGRLHCFWGGGGSLMADYHDTEWGFPVVAENRLFEKVCLEGFQSGLSWRTVLTKRPAFREVFHDFDYARVAQMGDADVERLLTDARIIRHRGKIEATVNNARRACEAAERHGSLAALLRQSGDPAALLGLVAAAGFAGAAVGIGLASRSLTDAPAFDRAIFTLTVMLVFQTAVNAIWFAMTDPGELRATARAWRPAIWVGVFSLLGSIGWAWGFTLESAAKVRTLGQIELIIAFVVARVTLGERHTRAEMAASGLVLVGVLIVTIAG